MSSHIYSGHPSVLNSVCFPSVFLWQHTGSFINAAPFGTQWGYHCKERWLMKWADTWREIFLRSRLESLFVWEKEHKDVLLWRHRKEPHIHSWAPCMALFCQSWNFSKCHRYDLFFFSSPERKPAGHHDWRWFMPRHPSKKVLINLPSTLFVACAFEWAVKWMPHNMFDAQHFL